MNVEEEGCVESSSSTVIPSFQYCASEWVEVGVLLPDCRFGVGGGRLMNS